MSPNKPQTNKFQSPKSKKVFDVVRPGKALASPTSRPVITGNSAPVTDRQIVGSHRVGRMATQPEDKDRPLMRGGEKIRVQPPSGVQSTKASAPAVPKPRPAKAADIAAPERAPSRPTAPQAKVQPTLEPAKAASPKSKTSFASAAVPDELPVKRPLGPLIPPQTPEMAAVAADVPLLVDEDDHPEAPVPEVPDIELNLDELAALSDLSDKKESRPAPVTAPLIPAEENLPMASPASDVPTTPTPEKETTTQATPSRDAIDDLLDDSSDDYEADVVAPKQTAPAPSSELEKLLAADNTSDVDAGTSSGAPAPIQPQPITPPKPAFRREELLAGAGMVMPDDAPQRMVVSTHKTTSRTWIWILVIVLILILAVVALNFLIDAEIFSLGVDVPTTNLL